MDSSISESAIGKQQNNIAIIYVMLAWRPSFARSLPNTFNLVLPREFPNQNLRQIGFVVQEL